MDYRELDKLVAENGLNNNESEETICRILKAESKAMLSELLRLE